MFLVLTIILTFQNLWRIDSSPFCPNQCSQHGICDLPTCICESGYTGADCSLRKCAYDLSWVDKPYIIDQAHALSECSNRGLCDRNTGICRCFEGYRGVACQKAVCPNNCGGHGECMDIGTIYRLYGQQVGANSYSLWDSDHSFGCVCEIGYTGPACEIRVCPKGDDPLTYSSGYKTIVLTVRNGGGGSSLSGSFQFTYQTSSFYFLANQTMSSSQCQSYFQSLPNFKTVRCFRQATSFGANYTVQFLSFPTLPYESNVITATTTPPINYFGCNTSQVYWGGQPWTRSAVGRVSCTIIDATPSTAVIPEYATCSNRGNCVLHTGDCNCYPGFSGASCSFYSPSKAARVPINVMSVRAVTTKPYRRNVLSVLTTGNMSTFTRDGFNYTFKTQISGVKYPLIITDNAKTLLTLDSWGNVDLNAGGLTVGAGETIYFGGLKVTGGATVNSGGILVKSFLEPGMNNLNNASRYNLFFGGAAVWGGGLMVTGGLTVADYGVGGITGGLTVSNTGLNINGGLGIIAGGMSIHKGGLGITGGLSINAGGLFVGTKGMTIVTNGLSITGGLTINSGSLGVSPPLNSAEGFSILSGGLYVQSSLTTSASSVNFLVTGGVSVTGGLQLSSGSMSILTSGLIVSGGVTLSQGLYLKDNSALTIQNGIVISSTLTVGSSVTVSANGVIVSGGGVAVKPFGLSVTGGLTVDTLNLPLSTAFISTGGLAVSNSLTLQSRGLIVNGGVTVGDTGVYVTTYGVSVASGGLLLSAGSMSVNSVGVNILGSITVASTGLKITAGGLTVNGGIVVPSGFVPGSIRLYGDLAVNSGGLQITGGITIPLSGVYSAAGVTIATTTSGLRINSGPFLIQDTGLSPQTLTIYSGGLIVSGGVTISTGILRVTGGVTILNSGLLLPAGLSVASSGLRVSQGGLTVSIGGLYVTTAGATVGSVGINIPVNGIQSSNGNVKMLSALSIYNTGLFITGGLTVIGGINIANVFDTAPWVYASGMTVSQNGILVTGGLSVTSGDVTVGGALTAFNGGLLITGGLTVGTLGLYVSGKMSILSGGIYYPGSTPLPATSFMRTSGGFTLYTGGLFVTGGLSIWAGGLNVPNMNPIPNSLYIGDGGCTTYDGGLTVSGGLSVKSHGLVVTGGMTVTTGGMKASSLPTTTLPLTVTGGMTISSQGLNIQYLPLSISSSGLVVSGVLGMTTTGGGLTYTYSTPIQTSNAYAEGGRAEFAAQVFTGGLHISGGMTVRGNAYLESAAQLTSASDRRLKEAIVPMEQSLAKVRKLKGVYFSWSKRDELEEMNFDSRRHIGLIAQEVQSVLPELVSEIHGGKYLGVNYVEMIPVLMEAIRELDDDLIDLAEKISRTELLTSMNPAIAERGAVISAIQNLTEYVNHLETLIESAESIDRENWRLARTVNLSM